MAVEAVQTVEQLVDRTTCPTLAGRHRSGANAALVPTRNARVEQHGGMPARWRMKALAIRQNVGPA
jgi:hypothetical protein